MIAIKLILLIPRLIGCFANVMENNSSTKQRPTHRLMKKIVVAVRGRFCGVSLEASKHDKVERIYCYQNEASSDLAPSLHLAKMILNDIF